MDEFSAVAKWIQGYRLPNTLYSQPKSFNIHSQEILLTREETRLPLLSKSHRLHFPWSVSRLAYT